MIGEDEIFHMTRHLTKVAGVLGSASTWALATVKKALPRTTAGQGRNYRPEAHYMRGPGPKWRAKHAQLATER
jgi:hypothetical protein